MKKIRRIFLILIFGICLCLNLPATGMPVIDISAIAEAVTEFIQEVQHWNQQIQQWKSEYDRLKKASEQIVSGDFTSVVQGIASLAGQMSKWTENTSLGRASEWGYAIEDGSYNLLSMISNSKLLYANMDRLISTFENNQKHIELTSRNDGEMVGDSLFNTADFSLSSILSLAQGSLNVFTDAAEMYNDIASLFVISPKEMAEVYEDTLKKFYDEESKSDKDSFSDYAGLMKAISAKEEEIKKATNELNDIDPTENPRMYNQKQAYIATLEVDLQNLNDKKAWVDSMMTEKEKILDKQDEYNRKQTEASAEKREEQKAEAKAELTESYKMVQENALKKRNAAIEAYNEAEKLAESFGQSSNNSGSKDKSQTSYNGGKQQ